LPALLFALLTLDGALGVATLATAVPAALSIAHKLGAVLAMAAALVPAMAAGPRRMG
jgi:heme A synthase